MSYTDVMWYGYDLSPHLSFNGRLKAAIFVHVSFFTMSVKSRFVGEVLDAAGDRLLSSQERAVRSRVKLHTGRILSARDIVVSGGGRKWTGSRPIRIRRMSGSLT